MKPLILFGNGKIAEVVLYFLRNHSDYEPVACTADRSFLGGPSWNGLPAVASKKSKVAILQPNT